ncbi:response regulator [Piscinibacter sp. HJYY11]|uniref:response regulator n=1 Tax=Piscinibacter sp. HJYY11 TaxID=2801333 RepID=UPI00191F8079|nr:response regulator [Piscinibacter sp. HJYY11]MBL0729290.1 response regulator [Piscinibacter sp. HJYY11]
MSERIPMRYTVALQGFSDFERSTLASFFRLGQQRAPAYVQGNSLVESDFVIADADSPAALNAVNDAHRVQDAIFIGSNAPSGAAAHLPRPIEPNRILRELDLLLEARLALLDEPPLTDWVVSSPDALGEDGSPALDVLVLDDSRIALKFLQTRLQGLGYRVHAVQTADEAMALLDAQAFSLVFLDIDLGDSPLDGLAVCQHLKQRQAHPGDLAPRVVIVTGSTRSSDRVRGDLAGCDAYLTKPLMEDEFMAALYLLDPTRKR